MDGHPGPGTDERGAVADLSGPWRATTPDPDLAKTFAAPDTPTEEWAIVRVPHHWRDEEPFARSDGPLLYRRDFTHAGHPERRTFLELQGVFYYGDVWLDGEYLGATDGWFMPHTFEVTDAVRTTDAHLLAIEVGCPPQRDRGAKRTLTGTYWHPPFPDTECNPGGIWRPVRLVETGPVRIANAQVVCAQATNALGLLECVVHLDAGDAPHEARLDATVRGPDGTVLFDATRDVTLAAGDNTLSWVIAVEEPPRWWPRTLGEQPLCTVELTVGTDDAASDRRQLRTAFRQVSREGARFVVNGERMFLKGATYPPARALLGDADDALLRRDVDHAIDANLDFLRVHAHVAPDALYDAADERGLLLWQDLPLSGGQARSVRRAANRQARALVERLGHHPSVFVWCAHDAPLGDDTPARLAAGAAAPTWGKDVLDRSVAHTLGRADPTRPVVRHTGSLDAAHLWFGWRQGVLTDLAPAVRALPRLATFVSSFGAQSVPETADWMEPDRWPDLDWETLVARHGLDADAMATHVPTEDAKTFDEWREATQAYQAALLQLQIEDLRRCKGVPAGGFAFASLVDTAPAVGFGILDHERVPKRAYGAVRDACRPTLATVDPRSGAVHVVHDGRDELAGATITVTADGREHRWQGTIAPDSIAYVGRVELAGAVDVEARLEHPATGPVVNRYPLVLLEAGRR